MRNAGCPPPPSKMSSLRACCLLLHLTMFNLDRIFAYCIDNHRGYENSCVYVSLNLYAGSCFHIASSDLGGLGSGAATLLSATSNTVELKPDFLIPFTRVLTYHMNSFFLYI